MNNLLGNMPPVVKNLLLLNVVMFIISWLGQAQGIPMTRLLGGYAFNSPFFEPYQMVTHFFMHANLFHIFFNMFALVIFGPVLEQVWGPKRFFIFYIATALGAFILHQVVGYIEINNLEQELIGQGFDKFQLHDMVKSNLQKGLMYKDPLLRDYQIAISIPVVGASGAVYGVLAAFALLFPNTKLMLLFPPIPVKAKWLVLFLIGIALFQTFQGRPGDNVAHLAHIGGALVGFVIAYFWRKKSNTFY